MNPIEAYQMFQGIKWFFDRKSYDYFKYRGRVNITQERFEARNDKYFFYKLSKKPDTEFFIASNIFNDDKAWVGDLCCEEADKIYRQRKGKVSALEQVVKNDLSRYDDLDQALTVRRGEYPQIVQDYMNKLVTPESLAVINKACNNQVFSYWENALSDKAVWPTFQEKIFKYGQFFSYNVDKYKRLLVDIYQ